jgi:hypothetical protein
MPTAKAGDWSCIRRYICPQVPDMCFETPPAQLYTLHGDGGILCAPMGGAGGGSPAILRRKNSKSMNYLKRLSRSASDLL